MNPIQKSQFYLFDDLPLEIIVIDRKGHILGTEYVQWFPEKGTLRFVRLEDQIVCG